MASVPVLYLFVTKLRLVPLATFLASDFYVQQTETGLLALWLFSSLLNCVFTKLRLDIFFCGRRSIPQPADSQWRATSAVARPVAGIPPSYPQHKLSILDNPMLFERLDTEALFFSFYYQPGSFQQYLAARELKRQSWRYHKHHGAWFQVQSALVCTGRECLAANWMLN